ncbi:hypothetical protein LUZ60_006391 [Juncus effusus]|nr:hypothetical protein LUZ60_006391 [Juncus effusus]
MLDSAEISHRLFIILSILLLSSVSLHCQLTDKQVLLQLKTFIQTDNPIYLDQYENWYETDPTPCSWTGIKCDRSGEHVTAVDLSNSNLSGELFSNFSLLTHLSHLDLSTNTISGTVPADLNLCTGLKYLNISHNTLTGTINLTGLTNLETLDISINRFQGDIYANFPSICENLITFNISENNFTGGIVGLFDKCEKLLHVDLSSNHFTGEIWKGFYRLKEFYVSENNLTGEIFRDNFQVNCALNVLDISVNQFLGNFLDSVSNCSELSLLSLWGNDFHGFIPSGIGKLSNLEKLLLGANRFDREIPKELLDCKKLNLLDLSSNGFGGEIQSILGNFTSLRSLVLHDNNYTSGIESSGILELPQLEKLDLSSNPFSGRIPVSISSMKELKFLVMAYNNFSGKIPRELGKMKKLQAIDLSYNQLTGEIPAEIGNLTSLLWLMLANNQLSGNIPPQIGNCTSLLWLNLARNRLTGPIPREISTIGSNPYPTFEANQLDPTGFGGSGECVTMRRWIPADYPPFSFIYTIMTHKKCRETWNHILRGYGVIPICTNKTQPIRSSLTISGYLEVSNNLLSGTIPFEIGDLHNLSLLLLDGNSFSGNLPSSIMRQPLVMLNVSNNALSGKIPSEIGDVRCLQNLDLSRNNFSGELPSSLNSLTDLSHFNASYNPLLAGSIPISGQLATFDNNSFIGDPLITFSPANGGSSVIGVGTHRGIQVKVVTFWVFFALMMVFLVCGFVSIVICFQGKSLIEPYTHSEPDELFLDEIKETSKMTKFSPSSSSTGSSSTTDKIRVFRLDRTTFTYGDIVTATGNFSEDLVVGRGGYGVVYRGVLPDGRQVAIKKLARINERGEGDGEREFRAEMEILAGRTGSGWPHPNLVSLYGWCLSGSTKLLVYEYLEGGSLEDLIIDWVRFGSERRLETAIEVARALVFLHHECEPAVVHRDVKASNVLLDREGRAKVTDFGLARVVGPGESHVSTILAGTVGYVAPEYVHTWRVTTKGDVYSFGVLLMELATGRRAVDGGDECLIEWGRRVRKDVRKIVSELEKIIMIKNEGQIFISRRLLMVGLRCTEELPQQRPDMREVLSMLLEIDIKQDSSVIFV